MSTLDMFLFFPPCPKLLLQSLTAIHVRWLHLHLGWVSLAIISSVIDPCSDTLLHPLGRLRSASPQTDTSNSPIKMTINLWIRISDSPPRLPNQPWNVSPVIFLNNTSRRSPSPAARSVVLAASLIPDSNLISVGNCESIFQYRFHIHRCIFLRTLWDGDDNNTFSIGISFLPCSQASTRTASTAQKTKAIYVQAIRCSIFKERT